MASTRHPDYRRFLDRLRQARIAAGLTQSEVAGILGRPQSYVSKCETGERRLDVVELAALARVYGKPLEYFAPVHKTRIAAPRRRRRGRP